MIGKVDEMDYETKIEYGLMCVTGAGAVVGSFAPLPLQTRILLAGVFFGITVGLWLSHLLSVTIGQVEEVSEG